jgi:hypothetical protein
MSWRGLSFFAYIVACWIGAPLHAAAADWGASSLRLSDGMTEQDAINAIGYQPNKVHLETCGAESAGGAWDCRVLTFGDRRNNLTVLERRSDESWVVNSWWVKP